MKWFQATILSRAYKWIRRWRHCKTAAFRAARWLWAIPWASIRSAFTTCQCHFAPRCQMRQSNVGWGVLEGCCLKCSRASVRTGPALASVSLRSMRMNSGFWWTFIRLPKCAMALLMGRARSVSTPTLLAMRRRQLSQLWGKPILWSRATVVLKVDFLGGGL